MPASRQNIQPPESVHSERRAPRRHSSVGALVSFFLVVVALIFVMSVLFRVNNISVEGNTHYTDEEIIRAIDIEEGDNLFFFDRFAALSRVFAKLPYIEEITIERALPDRVIIEVIESKALAYIPLGDENWTIDHNCKVLGKTAEGEETGLLKVEGLSPGTLLIGEQLTMSDGSTEPVEYLTEVLYQIQERGLYSNISGVDFSDLSNVQFSYGGKYAVYLGGNSNIEYKFGMLISALSQLMDGDIGVIDVSDGTTAHFIPN